MQILPALSAAGPGVLAGVDARRGGMRKFAQQKVRLRQRDKKGSCTGARTCLVPHL
jgi:hypothetical protein